MKKIAIVGFGRFGELLARLSEDAFDVCVVEADQERAASAEGAGHKVIPFESLGKVDYIFLAVPISVIENVLEKLSPLVKDNQVVIDLCSVKIYPVQLMKKYLPHVQILATHPMFGPDSAKTGLYGLPIALCPVRVQPDNLQIIKDFWAGHGCVTIETTPEAHDQDTVYSQAFTYSIAKIILGMDLDDVTFRTKSFDAITRVARLTANDTDQLFHDMLYFNPYFPKMKEELERSIVRTIARLDEIEAEQQLIQVVAR